MQPINSSVNGTAYFFTMTTHQRKPIFDRPANVIHLRQAFHYAMQIKPFRLDAISILSDHLHCIWRTPFKDTDSPAERWQLINQLYQQQQQSNTPLWQTNNWLHEITNNQDYLNHLDYIQLNPIKQGYVDTAKAWPFSSFDHQSQQLL